MENKPATIKSIVGQVDGVLTQFTEESSSCKDIEDWLRQSLTSLLESKAQEVEKLRLIEAAVNPESLMWKQRINGYLDDAAAIIRNQS